MTHIQGFLCKFSASYEGTESLYAGRSRVNGAMQSFNRITDSTQ